MTRNDRGKTGQPNVRDLASLEALLRARSSRMTFTQDRRSYRLQDTAIRYIWHHHLVQLAPKREDLPALARREVRRPSPAWLECTAQPTRHEAQHLEDFSHPVHPCRLVDEPMCAVDDGLLALVARRSVDEALNALLQTEAQEEGALREERRDKDVRRHGAC